MMAINFPAAAFLASLKSPSQNFLYCISQDTGAPVVVYKDSQSINAPPWSNHENNYNHQQKEIPHEATQQSSSTNQSTIRVEAGSGNQVAIPLSSQSNVTYTTQPATYYSTAPPHNQTSGYIQVTGGQVYGIHNPEDDKDKSHTHQQVTVLPSAQFEFSQNLSRPANSDDDKNFSCSLCKKSFRLKSTLIQHERIHLDSRPYFCDYDACRKSFRQKSHLIQHSRIHFDSKPYSCKFQGCGKSFRQRAILSQHERIHCDSSSHLLYKNVGENGTLWPHDLPYPIEIQPKDDTNLVKNHQKGQYPQFTHSVFGSLTDDDCQKTETKLEILTRQTVRPLYVRCPICQVSYKQKSTLLQHGCMHIESRPYPCNYANCGKRFRQQSHLAQHIRIHRNELPFQCLECGRCFRQKTILNQHIRIHTNSKPYNCKFQGCGKDFRQQAILSQHEKTHQIHKFLCPLSNCKRRFINEHDLKKHIENHMNPTKTKKQSARSAQLVKPETNTYMHHSISHSDALNAVHSNTLAYQPATFNQPLILDQQQMIQTAQAI